MLSHPESVLGPNEDVGVELLGHRWNPNSWDRDSYSLNLVKMYHVARRAETSKREAERTRTALHRLVR
jgi:hypothetical protein